MMSRVRRLALRLRNALRPGRDDADVAREIAAHLALSEEDFARRGLPPDAARLAARRALGGVEQTKSLHRTARSFAFIDDAWRDAWYAIVQGQPLDGGPTANFRVATPAYFSTMGLSIRAGRVFDQGDIISSPAVTVINDTLATRLFGSGRALGQHIALCPNMTTGQIHWFEVVGVVSSMRSNGLRDDLPSEIFMPLAQSPENLTMSLVVRSAGPLASLTPAIRRIAHDVDPLVTVYGAETLDELVARDRASSGFIMQLLIALGVTGVILAMVGVYGVIAYFVSQRAHEFGVRMAIGASTGRIVALVLRQGCAVAAVGVGLGTLGALAGSRLLGRFLFGVTARDPLTFVCVGVVLTLVALAASGIPARRAARVNPVTALRA